MGLKTEIFFLVFVPSQGSGSVIFDKCMTIVRILDVVVTQLVMPFNKMTRLQKCQLPTSNPTHRNPETWILL